MIKLSLKWSVELTELNETKYIFYRSYSSFNDIFRMLKYTSVLVVYD